MKVKMQLTGISPVRHYAVQQKRKKIGEATITICSQCTTESWASRALSLIARSTQDRDLKVEGKCGPEALDGPNVGSGSALWPQQTLDSDALGCVLETSRAQITI